MPEQNNEAALAARRPQLAVSAAIFRPGRKGLEMLLVRRARNPLLGLYTLPGGRVEFGETLHEALAREILEETSVDIEIIGLAGYREVLVPDEGRHFVILPFAARWRGGEVVLNEELGDHTWIAPADLGGFTTTEGLGPIVATAAAMAGG